MNLEDAANIGELLSGLAIIGTMIFGIRQIIELNKSKEKAATRELANLLASPMYQFGISVILNRLSMDFTIEDLDRLERKEKDALNYLVITTNSIGMLTFERQLSFRAVARFMGPVTGVIGQRVRTLTKVFAQNAELQGVEMEDNEIFEWTIWLLDRMDELPPSEGPANVIHKDWTP